MDEYPGNSRQTPKKMPEKSEAPKQEQITTGKVIVKKPGLGKRFASAFTGDDGRSVMSHVLWDVLVPAAKDMDADAGREAIDRALYGESRGRSARTNYNSVGSTLASRVNYNRPGFMQDPRERQQEPSSRTVTTRGNVSINDIILASRVEADEVISRMQSLTIQYGRATVADLFDLVGVTGQYTDEKFGWLNMDGARPHRTRNGYLLDLPNPVQLD